MIEISTMSDDYGEDEELADFIVSENEEQQEQQNQPVEENEEPTVDRIKDLTESLSVHESKTSRILRAHLSVLISALGGPDHTSPDGHYKLGHDALACLKDIKRWLRSVDEKNGTFDVALACAECGLVSNDLMVILCQWHKPGPNVKKTKTVEKIMLACLELLVLLTWPIDVNRRTLLKDYTARTNAKRAQLAYKYHILNYKSALTLKAVVGLGLPALTKPKDDREPRDINILRLILFFIRNILFIGPLPPSKVPKGLTNSAALPHGISAEDIGLNSVINAFEKKKVFLFLTSIAHSVLHELTDDSFGLLIVECLSLLTKGVQPETLLVPTSKQAPTDTQTHTTNVAPASSAAGLQLNDLLKEEENRKKLQKTKMSTRHGRFGSLLSIQNADTASYYTVSGQNALASTNNTFDKLDLTKKWHKMSGFKYDSNEYLEKSPVYLNVSNSIIILQFINEFLVSGCFNNVLRFEAHALTSASNEHSLGRGGILEAVDEHELASYFLTSAWFLKFKRERSLHYQSKNIEPPSTEDSLDYGSVGSALSEVHFILLISYFRASFESKDYDSLHVAMICLREMLLISHSVFNKDRTQKELELVSADDVDEDRELAEGIIRKLFSQKQFLDMVVNIPKQAAKHSPEYLTVVVATVHILLKCFESLANEDVKLFIRTRRKMSKLRRQDGGMNQDMDRQHWHLIDRGSDEEEDEDEMKYINQERKLDFKNTEVKFFHSETVSSHISYLSRYEDLTHEEIKRGISFFHRLFVVRKDYAALYRLDFMNLIDRLRNFLPRGSSIRRHVEEFIVYYMKKFKSALERLPTPIEILFPRFENLELKAYLSTGDLEASSTQKADLRSSNRSSYFASDSVQPREAPILEFSDKFKSLDDKLGALIYHMLKKKNGKKLLKFVTSELERIKAELEEGGTDLGLRLNLGLRRSMINDSYLRLLVKSIGFELPYLQNEDTILKKGFTGVHLLNARDLINKWISFHEGPVGDVEPFLDQIRHKEFTNEQLGFGQQMFAVLEAGGQLDENKVTSLGLDDESLGEVIGLARRKNYDDSIRESFDNDFDGIVNTESNLDDSSGPETTKKSQRTRRRASSPQVNDSTRRRRMRASRILSIDSEDERETPKPEVKVTRSAEMINDSDDESDDERTKVFFEREQKLRDLIQSTGGIVNKEQLEIFKTSWQNIISTTSDIQVKQTIERAANLFVESDDEDEGLSESANQKRPLEDNEETIKRKRRAIIDDEDD